MLVTETGWWLDWMVRGPEAAFLKARRDNQIFSQEGKSLTHYAPPRLCERNSLYSLNLKHVAISFAATWTSASCQGPLWLPHASDLTLKGSSELAWSL